MKYYSENEYIKILESLDYELLKLVIVDRSNHKSLILCKRGESGSGCIYEADEYFSTFLKLTYNIDTFPIIEDDYTNLLRDGKVFINKELSTKLRKAWGVRMSNLRWY